MATLEFHTAGESHGPALIALVHGMPADVTVDTELINAELQRRQGGYGRGGRQRIERDEIIILSGVRGGRTIGSPVALQLTNRDVRIDEAPPIHRPRPGHADYAGAMKWLTTDCRATLERASARETAARTAAGALARCLLREFDIDVVGFVRRIGPVKATVSDNAAPAELRAGRDANDVYCPDASAAPAMIEAIRAARQDKDTLGGIVEVRAFNLPPGLGTCVRWQDRLDGRLMAAVGSIQAFKGVEIGLGFGCAGLPGSRVHDEMDYKAEQRQRPSPAALRCRRGGVRRRHLDLACRSCLGSDGRSHGAGCSNRNAGGAGRRSRSAALWAGGVC